MALRMVRMVRMVEPEAARLHRQALVACLGITFGKVRILRIFGGQNQESRIHPQKIG